MNKNRHYFSPAIAAMVLMLSGPQVFATNYQFTTIGTLSSLGNVASDVNDSGIAVGYTTDYNTGISKGWTYSGGSLTSINGPTGALSSNLQGISNTGVVVGNYSVTIVDDGTGEGTLVPGPSQIFSYDGSAYQTISIPGAVDAVVNGVSPNGRWIIGNYTDALRGIRGFAFDTNPGGVTTFFSSSAPVVIAAGANDFGQIVGRDRSYGSGRAAGPGWVFDMATGLRTDFNFPGSLRTGIQDISNSGVLSGYYYLRENGPSTIHGFVENGTVVQTVDVPRAYSTFIFGANNHGELVGEYYDGLGNTGAFLAKPVPEPASAMLMLLGMAGIFGARRLGSVRG